MHELSIALSMMERISEELETLGGGRVETVYLRVGVMSGVNCEALRFAYEMAFEQTELESSRLQIESIPSLVYCPNCESERVPISLRGSMPALHNN